MKKFSNESMRIAKGIKKAVSNKYIFFVELIFGFSLGIKKKNKPLPLRLVKEL